MTLAGIPSPVIGQNENIAWGFTNTGLDFTDVYIEKLVKNDEGEPIGVEYDGVYLVKSFEDWKEGFLQAQNEVDQLMIMGVAAVEGWDDDAAAAFAESNTKIPTGTDFSWLMHVAIFGVGKSPEEQGRWAAKAALRILDGVSPKNIPLAYNTEGTLYFNPKVASQIGLTEPPPLAKIVD